MTRVHRITPRQRFILKFAAMGFVRCSGLSTRWTILRGHAFYRPDSERNPNEREVSLLLRLKLVRECRDPHQVTTDTLTGEKWKGKKLFTTKLGDDALAGLVSEVRT